LWFRVAETSDVVLIHRAMAAYRSLVPDSLTATASPLDIPPFFERMKKRAASGIVSPAEQYALLRMVGHYEITAAREALVLGQRIDAAHILLSASQATQTRRWWSTWLMVLFVPGKRVKQWQSWRVRRFAPRFKTR
jgi:hypothetical protein